MYSLPVVWFSFLDIGSYNFAAYIPRKDVIEEQKHLWMTPSWMTITIRLSPMLFTRRVLIARHWQHVYHNMLPSRIDCRLTRRWNLPWGLPLLFAVDTALWRSFECRKRLPLLKILLLRFSRNISWRKIPA